jgi:hypothetical protein
MPCLLASNAAVVPRLAAAVVATGAAAAKAVVATGAAVTTGATVAGADTGTVTSLFAAVLRDLAGAGAGAVSATGAGAAAVCFDFLSAGIFFVVFTVLVASISNALVMISIILTCLNHNR